MLFRFLIDGKEYIARMHDIPIVHEIAAACPIDQSWQRSDDHEYYTRLKRMLHMAGEKETSEIKKADCICSLPGTLSASILKIWTLLHLR